MTHSTTRKTLVFATPDTAKYTVHEIKDYSQSIADMQGWDWITVDLVALKECNNALVQFVNKLTTNGVMYLSKTYKVVGISSGTKAGRLFAYANGGDHLKAMFPAMKDAIRGSALHSPCYDGLYTLKGVHIVVVDDDNPDFQVGDGQMQGNEAFARLVNNDRLRQIQVRGKIGLSIAKGTVTFAPCDLIKNDDATLVIAKSCLKGSEPLPKNCFMTTSMQFGVMETAECRPMQVGYQVTQYWPESVWKVYRPYWKRYADHYHKLKDDPKLLILSEQEQPVRDANGRIDYMASLQALARIAQTNNDMLKHVGVAQDIAKLLSGKMKMALNGMPAPVPSFMGMCNNKMADGLVIINPLDWSRWQKRYKMDKQGILGRMPCDGHFVKVRVILSWSCTRGSIVMNGRTPAPLAGDFDGDYYFFITSSYSPWVKVWYEGLESAQAGEKQRAKGNPVATLGEKVANMVGSTPGTDPISQIAAGVTALRTLEHLAIAKQDFALAEEAEQKRLQLIVQQQAAVDTAKHDSEIDWEMVDDASEFCHENHLSWHDTVFRLMANGRVMPFVQAEEDICQGKRLLFSKNEMVIPSKVCWQRSPLSDSWVAFGNMMPLVELDTLPNDHFINWLPAPDMASEGTKWAGEVWNSFLEAGKAIRSMPNITDADLEAREKALSKAIADYSQANYECPLDETGKRDAALWQWFQGHKRADSSGAVWRYGLLEIIIALLNEHKDDIAPIHPTVTGYIIGKLFTAMMSKPEMTYQVTLTHRDNCQAFKFQDGSVWKLAQCSAELAYDEPFEVTIKKGSTEGRWPFMVKGITESTPAAVADSLISTGSANRDIRAIRDTLNDIERRVEVERKARQAEAAIAYSDDFDTLIAGDYDKTSVAPIGDEEFDSLVMAEVL